MYSVLIIEDNYIQLKTLSNIINQIGRNYHVYEASSIEEAQEISERETIHLFFIDINVNNKSGLGFAMELRKKPKYILTWIIFTTIYKDYMLSSFRKVHCYDYLLKPYDVDDIVSTTKTLLREENEVAITDCKEKFIIVNIKNIQVKIFIKEIIFVEVFIRTSIIHTTNGPFIIDYLSLKKLNGLISDTSILQSHRSYLVNIKYINKIEKTSNKTAYTIYFSNTKETALLGQNYKKDIMNRFNNSDEGGVYE